MESPRDAPERTPRGHDLGLLREMLALTPEERIVRNVQFVSLIEELRQGRAERHGSTRDLSGAR
jgi:hypothetical protein